MEILQEILVFIIFFIAAGYLFTKFVWKPAFLGGKKKSGSCGTNDCNCGH